MDLHNSTKLRHIFLNIANNKIQIPQTDEGTSNAAIILSIANGHIIHIILRNIFWKTAA